MGVVRTTRSENVLLNLNAPNRTARKDTYLL